MDGQNSTTDVGELKATLDDLQAKLAALNEALEKADAAERLANEREDVEGLQAAWAKRREIRSEREVIEQRLGKVQAELNDMGAAAMHGWGTEWDWAVAQVQSERVKLEADVERLGQELLAALKVWQDHPSVVQARFGQLAVKRQGIGQQFSHALLPPVTRTNPPEAAALSRADKLRVVGRFARFFQGWEPEPIGSILLVPQK